SGASVTSNAIMEAVTNALESAVSSEDSVSTFENLVDGSYDGLGSGFGGDLKVSVTVENGTVTNVEVTSHSETAGISDPAFATIPQSIIDSQSASVDVASSATVTSKAIMQAVANALS
ncbi:MAG: FMN-binding protein, partial [Clostridia bacterium]